MSELLYENYMKQKLFEIPYFKDGDLLTLY